MNTAPITMPDNWTTAVFERPGVRLRYSRTGVGDKPTLVLLHGGTDNGLCWYRVARDLEPDFDIVMPDARGHGETELDNPSFTLSDMVDDVARLIEHLGLAQVTLIGHSMGAQVSTEIAARYPQLVRRVVLEDPAYKFSTQGGVRLRLFGGAIRLGARWMSTRSPEQIRRLADRFFKTWADIDKDTWAVAQHQSSRKTLKSLMGAIDPSRDWYSYLRKVQAPALLVTADKGLIKADEAGAILAALPQGTAAHIALAGHNVRRDNYTDFMKAVTEFLRTP